MENKRMSELPVATIVGDEDYTVIVQDGINKRANRGIFKQKDYNDLENRPYINTTYTSSQTPINELFQGTIQLHKISKTGLYSDLIGLPFIATKLTELTNDGYFVQDEYYVHTDNNFTSGLLDKVNSAIQGISVNNNLLTPDENKSINIIVPVNLTDLTNDAYFVQDENYVHTDNNFTDNLKDNYNNLVTNVNQIVSVDNKLATMNDVLSIETGFWIEIDIYKNDKFNGVIGIGEEIPEIGTYAVIEGEDNYYINKYTNGVSDNVNIPVKNGYFVKVQNENTEIIYYVENNTWKKIANKVEKSAINGNLKIDGNEVNVYTKPELTKIEVTTALGYTPPTTDTTYDVVTTTTNGLMSSNMLAKLNGISESADSVSFSRELSSGTKIGSITINGIKTDIYVPVNSTNVSFEQTLTTGVKIGSITINGATTDIYAPSSVETTYDIVTTTSNGLMSSAMLTKLNGISESADSVSFSRSLTSGTKIGSITINGTATDIYAPTNTDTHYTTHLYVGTSTGNVNAATTNGNTYLMVLDNTTVRDRRLIKGTGATTVTSDSSGNITINSTNTTYGVATTSTNGLLSSTDKQKIDAIESTYLKKTENAVSATKLQTARKINGVAFDGTADINIDIAKEFYYSSIPMSLDMADMYVNQVKYNILPTDYYTAISGSYSGDRANNTLAYIYNISDGATYHRGYLRVDACKKADVEWYSGWAYDTRSTESRVEYSNWGDSVNISMLGDPENCKKVEYSFTDSLLRPNWQTGSDGDISYDCTFPLDTSDYYYASIRITFNDGTTAEYSEYNWFYWSGGGLACFTGDTLVKTKNGLIKIADIKEGDLILSRNEKECLMQYKEITKIYSHTTDAIFNIKINGKIIKTTWSHEFYVDGKGMVKASELKQGDIVKNSRNKRYRIEEIKVEKIQEKVYEILVKDNRNYFVGEDEIFVGCENIDNL